MCTRLCVQMCFQFSWSVIARSYGNSMFNFLGSCQSFPKSLSHSTFPPATSQAQFLPIVTNTPIVSHFDCSHLCGFEVIPHFGFGLHFPNDSWCWVYFPMLISPLAIFISLEKDIEKRFPSFAHFYVGLCFFCCFFVFFKIYLLIMLLQLSHSPPFTRFVGGRPTHWATSVRAKGVYFFKVRYL